MTDFWPNKYSYVDNKYGLQRNSALDKLSRGMDALVTPDMKLDWMRQLAKRDPIDSICEYYGILPQEKNTLEKYLNKWIQNPDHIWVVEEHFVAIGMPIHLPFLEYQEWWNKKSEPTWEMDILKSKQVELEKRHQALQEDINSLRSKKQTNDWQITEQVKPTETIDTPTVDPEPSKWNDWDELMETPKPTPIRKVAKPRRRS